MRCDAMCLPRRGKRIRDVAVMRASQLDAGRLDTELTAMLREQFMRIFSLIQPVSQPRSCALLQAAAGSCLPHIC